MILELDFLQEVQILYERSVRLNRLQHSYTNRMDTFICNYITRHGFLKEDEEYQKRRKESLRQEGILKTMNLPEDIKNQIDLLTCSINDHWSRYAELVYQYAMEDILTFLIER